jgi:hypothetical protein
MSRNPAVPGSLTSRPPYFRRFPDPCASTWRKRAALPSVDFQLGAVKPAGTSGAFIFTVRIPLDIEGASG